MKRLVTLAKPFKYVVTAALTQKSGGGMHIASTSLWDDKTDCTPLPRSTQTYSPRSPSWHLSPLSQHNTKPCRGTVTIATQLSAYLNAIGVPLAACKIVEQRGRGDCADER